MCYKYLWDNLIAEKFPAENFFSYFDLDPNYLLSDDIRQYISSLGFNAKVLCLTFKLCVCFFLIVLRQFTVDANQFIHGKSFNSMC
jgi:hypothetical protein